MLQNVYYIYVFLHTKHSMLSKKNFNAKIKNNDNIVSS